MRIAAGFIACSFALQLVFPVLSPVLSLADSQPQARSQPQIQVQVLDPDFDASGLAGPNVKIHSPSEAQDSARQLPSPRVEDRLFADAGITDAVSSWDRADRDLLFIRARDLEVDRLKSVYPSIPGKNLKQLSDAIRDGARK